MFLTSGTEVFRNAGPFDESHVLESIREYLLSTLAIKKLTIKKASEADEKIQEDCCPLDPFIFYFKVL